MSDHQPNLRFQITITDRSDEWSPDNPALLMPTQSVTDTPGSDVPNDPAEEVDSRDSTSEARFRITAIDRSDEWSPDNPAC